MKHVLLQEPAGNGDSALHLIAPIRYVPAHPGQDLEVLLDRLLKAVMIVPDTRVRRVDRADLIDVAGFNGAEKPFGDLQNFAHGTRR